MLSVRLNGIEAGYLEAQRDGSLSFRYSEAWLKRPAAYQLSMSMPLSTQMYGEAIAGPWFDGLLPDNRNVRETLARRFEIDAGDDYGLLEALGRECPGAVSVMPLDAEQIPEDKIDLAYSVLSVKELADHIRNLPTRPLFVDADGEMRLSLPGVHHKSAVLLVSNAVALSRDRTPTTHILKVDIQGLPDSIRVENFCLRVAGAVGLKVPRSRVYVAEDQTYMLIARYDRMMGERADGTRFLRRLHQEDFCQATGRYPREKYEKDGGPGWKDCFKLLDRTSDPISAKTELLNRAIFQFLIGNPDAHAKNYSLVHRSGRTYLSKLYDLNNAAAFREHYKEQRPRLAMWVGGERNPDTLEPAHWNAFAEDIGLRRELVKRALRDLAGRLPEACRQMRAEFAGSIEDSHLLDIVLEDVSARCARAVAMLDTDRGPRL